MRKQYKKVKNRLYRFKRIAKKLQQVAIVSADCEQAARLTLAQNSGDLTWANKDIPVDMISRESLCVRGIIAIEEKPVGDT